MARKDMCFTFSRSALLILASFVLLASRAEGQGPALSGLTAYANDATAAFSSPAGITRIDEAHWVVQTIALVTESKFHVDQSTFGGGDGDNDLAFNAIPGLFYVRPLSDRWTIGFSANVPSGVGFDYGKDWSGRYHVTEAELAFVAAQAVAAYEVTDELSVAAGPMLMYVDSQQSAEVNNIEPGSADGKVELDENGADLGFVLGAMYEFTDSTRLGLTYRSELEPDLEGTPTFTNLGPGLRAALAAADLLGTEVDVDLVVPAVLQVGAYTEFSDRWSMTGDVIWVDMSEFGITSIQVEQDSVSVDGAFRDVWVTTAGLRYQLDEERAVSVGGLYATSAVKDRDRVPALPLDRVWGVGVGYDFRFHHKACRLNLNYFHLGDGDLSADGGPLTGDFEGSFNRNWALMLDLQVRL